MHTRAYPYSKGMSRYLDTSEMSLCDTWADIEVQCHFQTEPGISDKKCKNPEWDKFVWMNGR